jgi:hypothetical protein
LIQLKDDCMKESILNRPSFKEINQRLNSIS